MAKTPTRKRRASSSKSRRGGGVMPWMLLGLAVLGGITIHDHWNSLPKTMDLAGVAARIAAPVTAKEPARPADVERTAAIPARQAPQKFLEGTMPVPPVPVPYPSMAMVRPASLSQPANLVPVTLTPTAQKASGAFGYCGQGEHVNCVAAGDMFWYKGEKIIVADIVTPQVETARCPEERRLAFASKARLLGLLNEGGFNINQPSDSPRGAAARMLWRDGRSLGARLMGEGLARRSGSPTSWCS